MHSSLDEHICVFTELSWISVSGDPVFSKLPYIFIFFVTSKVQPEKRVLCVISVKSLVKMMLKLLVRNYLKHTGSMINTINYSLT